MSNRVTFCCCGLSLVLLLASCGDRAYDRVVVVGLLVPVKESVPASGEHQQPLPPMPEMPIQPDTADGSVLVGVDQHQFFLDRGQTLPSYEKQPDPAASADPRIAELRRIVEALRSVHTMLTKDVGTMESGAVASKEGTSDGDAVLLFKPSDWHGLVTLVMRLTIGIDSMVAQSWQPGPDGTPVEGLNGDATHNRLYNELWRGMDIGAKTVLDDSTMLGSEGALHELSIHPEHGPVMDGLLANIKTQAVTLSGIVNARSAPELVQNLRYLQQRIDELEDSPLATLAFGYPKPGEPGIDRANRDDSRIRLARLRMDLVGLAAQWTANNAKLLEAQPEPTVVYHPPGSLPSP